MNIVSFEYLDLSADDTGGFINHPEKCALTLKNKSSSTQYNRMQCSDRKKSINMLYSKSAGQHFGYIYGNTDLE